MKKLGLSQKDHRVLSQEVKKGESAKPGGGQTSELLCNKLWRINTGSMVSHSTHTAVWHYFPCCLCHTEHTQLCSCIWSHHRPTVECSHHWEHFMEAHYIATHKLFYLHHSWLRSCERALYKVSISKCFKKLSTRIILKF